MVTKKVHLDNEEIVCDNFFVETHPRGRKRVILGDVSQFYNKNNPEGIFLRVTLVNQAEDDLEIILNHI